ncbi:hypothetical protein EV426DRAFT_685764 [Tirmania nivea]|nr:hypothetical protein EV426DRAFT_685764 [Tirmania nivea]
MACIIHGHDTQARTDHSKVKGWPPIVLANTVGKLGEKLIADELQSHLQLFHNLQYGLRKGRLAIDTMMLTLSHAERAIKQGKKATLLGKDIISAFNNGKMDEGTPQTITPHAPTFATVYIFSYVDDINPLIISDLSTMGHNKALKLVNAILNDKAEEDELTWGADKESRVDFHSHRASSCTTLGIRVKSNLSWDEHIKIRTEKAANLLRVLVQLGNSNGGMSPLAMRSLYTGAIGTIFSWGRARGKARKEPISTRDDGFHLRRRAGGARSGSPAEVETPPTTTSEDNKSVITIGEPEVKIKLEKLEAAEIEKYKMYGNNSSSSSYGVFPSSSYGGSFGGPPPPPAKKQRTTSSGSINSSFVREEIFEGGRIRTYEITGGYHGSNHEKLGWIANIEPLQENPHLQRGSAIMEAFYKTAADNPAELSYGNRDYNRVFPIIYERIMDPRSELSKVTGYWAGRKEGVASAVRSEDRKGGDKATYGKFLGDLATVADGELRAMQLALNTEESDMLAILLDSQAAIQSVY